MGLQAGGMGEKRYGGDGGDRGDRDSVGMGSEQSRGWAAPGAAEGREVSGRKSHALCLLAKNWPPQAKQTVLDKELSLHRVSCCSGAIAAAPGAVASLLVAPGGGKTQPTTISSSDGAGATFP